MATTRARWRRDEHELNDRSQKVPHPRSTPENRTWVDLATNTPGQGVARLAAAHRRARPVTSRLEPLLGVQSDAQVWAKTAAADRATAKALRPLTHVTRGLLGRREPRWKVLHSIPLGDTGTDIDHLLIGPAGVFAIASKNHTGKTVWVGPRGITIDRALVRYSPKALADARRAQALLAAAHPGPSLDVDVWAIIVMVGAIVTGRHGTADGVLVTSTDDLVNRMLALPEILSDAQVDAVYDTARRSTTWSRIS